MIIKVIFAPEHGFRGNADAGEHVGDAKDKKTGIPVISLRVTSETNAVEDTPVLVTGTLKVVSAATDYLFSDDDKLKTHEPDIDKYLAPGRGSFKDTHRRAQALVLAYLDTEGYIDGLGEKFTKDKIHDLSEVREWATMTALRLIFEGLVVSKDDVFTIKVAKYEAEEHFYRNRAGLRADINGDGAADQGEQTDVRTCRVVRR